MAEQFKRIMVADVDPHSRLFLRKLLASIGAEVVQEVTHGDKVLPAYRTMRPDLLLMEVTLPGKSGDTVLSELIDEFPDALVVMVSSVADMETVERCLSLGSSNYILKGSPTAEILGMIEETLGQSATH